MKNHLQFRAPDGAAVAYKILKYGNLPYALFRLVSNPLELVVLPVVKTFFINEDENVALSAIHLEEQEKIACGIKPFVLSSQNPKAKHSGRKARF